MKRIICLAVTIMLLCTLLFVSCSNDIMNDALDSSDTLVWATFGNGNSRGNVVESAYTQTFELKDESEVYWTYTATKTAGDKGGKTGVTTTETPVQSNFGKGLNGAIGPFSQGKWDFNICGYVGTPVAEAPSGKTEGRDYFKVIGKDSSGTEKTMYYTERIYYGSVTEVVLSTGTATDPDPINVIINIVTEGKGTFAITNTSTFRWQNDNGDNPENMYMKMERKTENGTKADPEYIVLTATQVSGSSENYYYTLPEAATSTWDAGYWTVNCSVVQATNTDGAYTDIYTYAKSPDLLIKIYAGQTTNLEAKVIEENLAYGQINVKIVDGITTTTVTKEVVVGTDTVLSSSLTPASAASDEAKIDTSKSTKVTVPSTVKAFIPESGETKTAALTVSATPIETANKTIVATSNKKAVNAIDLKALVTTTKTGEESNPSTEEVKEFKDKDNNPVAVVVDTVIETELEDVQLYYTYPSDYTDSNGNGSKAGTTEYWNAIATSDAVSGLTYPGENETVGVCYYDRTTGRIVYKTIHFSSFVVTSAKIEAYNRTTGKKYTSLDKALADASDGDTLILMDNSELSSEVTLTGKNITLDMGFYTLSGANKISLGADGVLIVKNSAADQTDFVDTEAKIGTSSNCDGTYYPTVYDALENAADNQIITLLKDSKLSNDVALVEGVSIDLNSKTLTLSDDDGLMVGDYEYPEVNVVIKNGNLVHDKVEDSVFYHYGIFVYSGTLTLDDVTMSGGEGAESGIYVNDENGATLAVNNSTLQLSAESGIEFGGGTPSETVTGSVTITSSTVKGSKYGLVLRKGTSATVKNSELEGNTSDLAVFGGSKVTGTLKDESSVTLDESSEGNVELYEGNTVYIAGLESFDSTVKNLEGKNVTIKLLQDLKITEKQQKTYGKNFTLDLNEKTLYLSKELNFGYDAAGSIVFVNNTIRNGNISVAYGGYIRFEFGSEGTFEDIKFSSSDNKFNKAFVTYARKNRGTNKYTFTDCTFTDTSLVLKGGSDGVNRNNFDVEFTGCTFTSTLGFKKETVSTDYAYGSFVFDSCNFTDEGITFASRNTEDSPYDIDIKDCTFIATSMSYDGYFVGTAWSGYVYGTMDISNTTFTATDGGNKESNEACIEIENSLPSCGELLKITLSGNTFSTTSMDPFGVRRYYTNPGYKLTADVTLDATSANTFSRGGKTIQPTIGETEITWSEVAQ